MAASSTNQGTVGGSIEGVHTVPLVIGGKEIYNSDTLDVCDPRSGNLVHRYVNATVDDALNSIRTAAEAFETWKHSTPQQRRDVFLKAAHVIERRVVEFKEYLYKEIGGDERWADFNVTTSKEYLLDAAGKAGEAEGRLPHTRDPAHGAMVVKEPYGVILAIAPWNAPYVLGFRAVIWPIAAGNTTVLKGSELSPRCFWAICSVLEEAGLPKGVLNYIACEPKRAPEVVKAMIEHRDVKKINFTGSTNIGRVVGRLAGENLKPVLLELGGKAPAIVCQDADLSLAARHCVLGAFLYSGQICMSTERIIVHKSVQEAFEGELLKWLKKLYSEDNDGLVVISKSAASRHKALIRNATEKGARVLCNSPLDVAVSMPNLPPVVLTDVEPTMDIYQQESFGPTVSLITYETEDEALAIANDTNYGLSSAIFSRDLRNAFRLAKRMETGAVHINYMTVHDEGVLPYGGAKDSGFGRFNTALEEWVRLKSITFDT